MTQLLKPEALDHSARAVWEAWETEAKLLKEKLE